MTIIRRVASALQDLFGTVASAVADKHKLITRKRKFTGTSLLGTFVAGFWHKPHATVADLADTAAQLGVDLTPQAVAKRYTPQLANALRDLFDHAISRVIEAEPRALALLESFPAVLVNDSSTIVLTPELAQTYPGCGGTNNSGKAALKLQMQWDQRTGGLTGAIETGRSADATSPVLEKPIAAGSLVLRDLGYFNLERFQTFNTDGIYWISRGLSQFTVEIEGRTSNLVGWLQRQTDDLIDRSVKVGDVGLNCRLVALRVPQAIAKERRRKAIQKAKKKGRKPSEQHLASCEWTIFLTNLPADSWAAQTIHTLDRVRWQMELVFQLWKSHHAVEDHRYEDATYQQIELYAVGCGGDAALDDLVHGLVERAAEFREGGSCDSPECAAVGRGVTRLVSVGSGADEPHRPGETLRARPSPQTTQHLPNPGKNSDLSLSSCVWGGTSRNPAYHTTARPSLGRNGAGVPVGANKT